MPLRLIVCGGRDYHNREAVFRALDAVHAKRSIAAVIHGDASGADRLAHEWALQQDGMEIVVRPANWKLHGRSAGPKRNIEMLALKPDGVIAFPGGKGTAHMVGIAKAAGLPVWQPMT